MNNCSLRILFMLFCLMMGAGPFAMAQTGSNKGTEFWTAFPSHEADVDSNFNALPANFSVFVTSDRASSGVITAGAFTQTFTVNPNQVTEIKVPRATVYIDESETGQVLSNRAIHLLVDAGQPPVVMYAHIFAGQRSAASLVLPKEALGQVYYSMNYQEQDFEGKNFIVVIATEPHTRLHFKKGNTELVPGGVLLDAVNDVYEYLSDNDLTGVSVTVDQTGSCNRFALFSGSTGVSIGRSACTPNSLDPLFQQNYPVESWGLTYGFVPFSTQSQNFKQPVRTAGQFIRVLAQNAGTSVMINGINVAQLDAGEFYTTATPLTEASIISADKPVCVAQYALSQICANATLPAGKQPENYSDPDMVILNPIALNINNITVYSSTREHIAEQYINVLMKTSASPSFRINGAAPAEVFHPVTGLAEYSYVQLNVSNYPTNTFTLSADQGFNAIAYGFGNVESYAYSAGTNLVLTQRLSGIRTANQALIDSACVNDDFSFRLTLPYQAASISWKMDDSETAVLQNAPVATVGITNNKVLYDYPFPRTPAYENPGFHHCHVIVTYAQNGNCNAGEQLIDYDFSVQATAVANFQTQTPGCANKVYFEDKSDLNGARIVAWQWNFGDQYSSPDSNISLQTNPVHIFPKSGTYQISLTVTSAAGCQTVKLEKVVISDDLPTVQFDKLPPVCLNTPPFIISAGKELTGAPGQSSYSGPGIQGNGMFDPAAAGAGKHRLNYIFTETGGCAVTAYQDINVLTPPRANDLNIQLYAGETTTLRPDYAGDSLSYQWSPKEGLSASDVAYPIANPAKTTVYNLTLTNGSCTYSAKITVDVIELPRANNAFTPNGDGFNDTWEIAHIEDYPQAAVSIFNRYGIRVFYAQGLYKAWDGRYRGVPVPWGVYYYLIEFDKRRKPLTGSLTLIR